MKDSVLNGKTLVALGDSLFYGNKLGNSVTWVNKLASEYNMTVYNHGINGNTLAAQSTELKNPPMCVRYKEMEDNADYVVVIGGANDKRLCVPIGNDDDSTSYTFKGALNILITGLTEKYPKAKILFMTNYQRWPKPNSAGIFEYEYVDAMKEICALHSIPCFDNFRESGISFQNPAHLKWIDEGLYLGIAENHHFTEEAYEWLLPKYAALLSGL